MPETQSRISLDKCGITILRRILTVRDGEWSRPKAGCAERHALAEEESALTATRFVHIEGAALAP